MARRFLITTVSVASLAGATFAQQPDITARQKQVIEIADQKADAHVRDAIRDAQKLAKTSVKAATEQLKQVRLGLDLISISNTKKEELFKVIDQSIITMTNPGSTPLPDPATPKIKSDQNVASEAMKKEVADVTSGIAEVSRLYEAGMTREAERKAHDLANRYPNNPAAFSLVQKGHIGDLLADSKMLVKLQSDRVLYTYNDVQRSAIPVKGDIEFPKDWNERMKNRPRGEKLSPELESIIKALDKPIPTQLQSMPFEEAVQQLSTEIDKPIYLDKKSLEDLPGFDMKKAVTPLAVPKGTPLSARTVLRALLQSQGLTFVVRDNIIQVVTVEKAQTMLSTKAYYIGDIISAVGPYGGAVKWGVNLDAQQAEANVKGILDAIRGYDPMAWRERTGGASSVTFHYPSMSIIVKAPAEVHATLGSALFSPK
ncbi:MAG: hypothetical protein U0798_16160 [Gemmataceae bacterium]